VYCGRCGTSLTSSSQFCSACGKAVVCAPIAPASPDALLLSEGRVRRHIHRLATLWLVNGILRLLMVGWFMVFGTMFFPL
jgi:predicted amidophosphoribosyltransferase